MAILRLEASLATNIHRSRSSAAVRRRVGQISRAIHARKGTPTASWSSQCIGATGCLRWRLGRDPKASLLWLLTLSMASQATSLLVDPNQMALMVWKRCFSFWPAVVSLNIFSSAFSRGSHEGVITNPARSHFRTRIPVGPGAGRFPTPASAPFCSPGGSFS